MNTERDFLWPLRGTFVGIYDIELRDQEFLARFVSVDILWALRFARCAPVIKAINGLSLPPPLLFLQHRRLLPHTHETHACRGLGSTVIRIRLAHIFCSHFNEEIRRVGRGGRVAHCAQLTCKCQEGGGTSLPWKPRPRNV